MLGQVARKFATSQMSRTLATLLGGGLPLVNALDIASNAIGNQFMAKQLEIACVRVREGQSFAAALEARGAFPEVAIKIYPGQALAVALYARAASEPARSGP